MRPWDDALVPDNTGTFFKNWRHIMRTMYKAAIERVKGKNTDVVKSVNVERSQEQAFLDLGYVFDESGEPAPETEVEDSELDPNAGKAPDATE